jgi:hypothetical protein
MLAGSVLPYERLGQVGHVFHFCNPSVVDDYPSVVDDYPSVVDDYPSVVDDYAL